MTQFIRFAPAENAVAQTLSLQTLSESASAAVQFGNIERAQLVCREAAAAIASGRLPGSRDLSGRLAGLADLFERHPNMLADPKMRSVFSKAVSVSFAKAAAASAPCCGEGPMEIAFPDQAALRAA